MYGMCVDFQEACHFHTTRRQDEYWWPMIEHNLEFYLSRPVGRAWWDYKGRNMLDQKFVAYVNEQIGI